MCVCRVTKTPRGFGFITFKTEDAAQRACRETHNIDGRTVWCIGLPLYAPAPVVAHHAPPLRLMPSLQYPKGRGRSPGARRFSWVDWHPRQTMVRGMQVPHVLAPPVLVCAHVHLGPTDTALCLLCLHRNHQRAFQNVLWGVREGSRGSNHGGPHKRSVKRLRVRV